jgi:Zn-dependent protease
LPALYDLIPLFIVLILSLSFHEAAHAWMADRLGDPTARHLGRLTLNPLAHIDWIGTVLFPLVAIVSGFPLLGWAKPVPVNWYHLRSPRRDFAVIAAAGPASNLILAVGSATLLLGIDSSGGGSSTVQALLAQSIFLNVLLAVFNLLPVPPLDGSRVVLSLLPAPAQRAFVRFERVGMLVVLLVVLNTPLLPFLVGPVVRFVVGLAY